MVFHEDEIHFDLIVSKTKCDRKDKDANDETDVQDKGGKNKGEDPGPGYMGWKMKDNVEKPPQNETVTNMRADESKSKEYENLKSLKK